MKSIGFFLSENYQVLEVKLSIYLNRRVFVMVYTFKIFSDTLCSSKQVDSLCL